jgi:hypothetical protein
VKRRGKEVYVEYESKANVDSEVERWFPGVGRR